MKTIKLKYTDKETAIADLIAKNVYQEIEEQLAFGNNVYAVVEIGLIALDNGTFDEEGNVLTEPTYAEGYHYDLLVDDAFEEVFTNEIIPNNPKHSFYGF